MKKYTFAVILGVLAACDAGRTHEVVPGSKDIKGNEQSEVALGVASQNGLENLVAVFQDNTSELQNPSEFSYSNNYATVTLRRGASLIGFSTATDPEGTGWLYHGKIRGTNALDSAAFLAGDPGIAVDPSNPSRVYVSAMMVSNRQWNKFVHGDVAGDEENEVSGNSIAVAINGFCVARSTDAGETFPEIKCVETSEVAFQAIDLTSVAVDAKGCVWLATTDTSGNEYFSRIYRSRPGVTNGICSDWSAFEDVTPFGGTAADGSDLTVYFNDVKPKVKVDHEGNVYFSTLNLDPSSSFGILVVRKFNVVTGQWEWVLTPSPACLDGLFFPMGKGNLNRLVLPSGAFIKQAFPYDFAVGIDETGMIDMRIAIQTQVIPTDSNDPQRVLHVFSRQAHPDGSCSPALAWSQPATALINRGASAFQPVMAVRHGQSSGSVWSMAYLTTADVSDPTKDYVRVEARQLVFLKQTIGGVETFVPFPGIPIIMSPKSSWVCSTTGGYWGDYFGLAYHRDIRGALHLTSAFSSSGLGEQVCAIKAPLVASPLHVESATF